MARSHLLFLAVVAYCLCVVNSQCFKNQADRERRINSAINEFIFRGYEVERGTISFEAVCKPDSVTCWGANPSSPYGRYKLRTPLLVDLKLPVYQLGPSETIVFFGCTPPRARYFGLQSYVFLSDDHLLFASMGDSINFLTANISGPTPFDQEWLVSTSGDQRATENAFDVFHRKANVSRQSMNADIIPNASALGIDPIGYGLNHSIFTTLFRVALCDDASACSEYMRHNWTILRVRPLNTADPLPYPLTPLRPRWTGVTEDALAAGQLQLVQAVQASITANTTTLNEVRRVYPLFLDGRTCIANHTDCLGDTRDTVYMDGDEPLNSRAGPSGLSFLLTDSPDDFLIVVGVLHNIAPPKLATYTNLAVYLPSKAMGVLAVVDTQMTNSSSRYGGQPYYYVQKFARHCHGEIFCTEVPVDFPGIPLTSNLTFVERGYINPATKVGADPRALQGPIVLHYIPKTE